MVVLATAVPFSVSAHDVPTLLHDYCSRVLVFEAQNDAKVKDIEKAYETKEASRLYQLNTLRKKQDDELSKKIAKRNEAIQEFFNDLGEGSTDPRIVKAREELNTSISSSTTAYDLSVKTAISNYRSGIDRDTVARKALFVASETAFKKEVLGLLSKTKTDCGTSSDANAVFVALTTGLKASLENFKKTIDILDTPSPLYAEQRAKRGEALSKAEEARKASISGAVDNFKRTILQK